MGSGYQMDYGFWDWNGLWERVEEERGRGRRAGGSAGQGKKTHGKCVGQQRLFSFFFSTSSSSFSSSWGVYYSFDMPNVTKL